MRHLNRGENCSKMFHIYMFKKHGRLSFEALKSKKENTPNSTWKPLRGIKGLPLQMMLSQHFSFSVSALVIGPEGPTGTGVLTSHLSLLLYVDHLCW